jgi:predicted aminopeptidase
VNISSITAAIRASVAALLAISSSGCYLLQSVQGHLSLMSKREPIAQVIDSASTPQTVRAQLKAVTAIRDFASHDL